MASWLYRLGAFEARRPLVFIAAWLAGLAVLVAAVGTMGARTTNDQSLPGTDSQRALDLLGRSFPSQQNGTSPIVFHVSRGTLTSETNKKAVEASFKAIERQPHVAGAVDPMGKDGGSLVSKDRRTAFIPVLLDVSSGDLTEGQAARVLAAARPARAAGIEVAAGGPIGSALSQPDTESSEAIGLAAAMVILALTFGTLVAMGMPILSAVLGLAAGLSIVGLAGHLFSIPSVGTTLAIMIGLGVGIDYALFLVSRHLAQLAEGAAVQDSIARTVAGAGSAVVFAATTVVVALVSLAVARIPLVAALGYAAAFAVLTAVLAAVTLLPAVLALTGRRIEALRLPRLLHAGRGEGRGVWRRWAGFVTARPLVALGIALAFLVPLTIPAFSLRLGQEDVGVAPLDTTERRAFDLMAAGFGPGYNGPLLVAVSLRPGAEPSAAYTKKYDEATHLQKTLPQQQKKLQQQAAALKRDQAGLERRRQQLLAEQKQLQARQQRLLAEQGDLQRRRAVLERQRAALRRQAEALRAEAAPLVRRLAGLRVLEARLQRVIARTQDPARLARLQARLALVRQQESALRGRLAPLERQARGLAAQARTLAAQAARLAAQAAVLRAQADVLRAQAARLQAQGAQLQREAATLQDRADELQRQKKQLQKEADRAKRLQRELTTMLTRAGGDPRGTDPRVVKLQDALGTPAGVSIVAPPSINKSGDTTVMNVIATTRPADPRTADLVSDLRDTVIPGASAAGMTAYVGGSTAANVDLAALIARRLPLVIVTVLVVSFLLLLLATRSLVVPLQAAATNLLCVAAAFGVLTAVFQWGWGLSLIGLDSPYGTVPIASYVPLMMFAGLFGLSMDYEVFLVSQIGEQRARGRGPQMAVSAGVAASGRVIAAAGLIMISVFGSFIINGDPVIKQFGVGLAVAVLLAAAMTLLLAPAVLALVGRALWWLPRPLARALPDLGIGEGGDEGGRDGAGPQPAPAPRPLPGAVPPGSALADAAQLAADDHESRPAA